MSGKAIPPLWDRHAGLCRQLDTATNGHQARKQAHVDKRPAVVTVAGPKLVKVLREKRPLETENEPGCDP
jgi:hypothetical protein